jgi:hypothetical protein
MSNCYCHPGRAGGLPLGVKNLTWMGVAKLCHDFLAGVQLASITILLN